MLLWQLPSPSVGSGCTLCSSCPSLRRGRASTRPGSALEARQCTQHDAGDDGQAAAAAGGPLIHPFPLWFITTLGNLVSPLSC